MNWTCPGARRPPCSGGLCLRWPVGIRRHTARIETAGVEWWDDPQRPIEALPVAVAVSSAVLGLQIVDDVPTRDNALGLEVENRPQEPRYVRSLKRSALAARTRAWARPARRSDTRGSASSSRSLHGHVVGVVGRSGPATHGVAPVNDRPRVSVRSPPAAWKQTEEPSREAHKPSVADRLLDRNGRQCQRFLRVPAACGCGVEEPPQFGHDPGTKEPPSRARVSSGAVRCWCRCCPRRAPPRHPAVGCDHGRWICGPSGS